MTDFQIVTESTDKCWNIYIYNPVRYYNYDYILSILVRIIVLIKENSGRFYLFLHEFCQGCGLMITSEPFKPNNTDQYGM